MYIIYIIIFHVYTFKNKIIHTHEYNLLLNKLNNEFIPGCKAFFINLISNIPSNRETTMLPNNAPFI